MGHASFRRLKKRFVLGGIFEAELDRDPMRFTEIARTIAAQHLVDELGVEAVVTRPSADIDPIGTKPTTQLDQAQRTLGMPSIGKSYQDSGVRHVQSAFL